MVQRLEGGGRAPTQHSTITYHKSGNKTQVCQSMGWKGGKEIPQHGRSGQKVSLKTMLDTLADWTRPKSDEIAAFTQLTLNQDNNTLSTYIQEVRRVVDLCNFNCTVWETARTG